MLAVAVVLGVPTVGGAQEGASGTWGRVANTIHRGERIYSAVFFAGPPNPHSLPLYTRHPKEAERLNWNNDADIDFSFQQLISAGLNTVTLSYWGHEGETDQWGATWLFSQHRWPGSAGEGNYTEAEQVELARRCMRRATAQGLNVSPLLEVSPKFPFYAEFPEHVDPLVARSEWLLRALGAERNWLRMYDRNGKPRLAISLIETIHAGPVTAEQFAAGFDRAAAQIEKDTGYAVGFIIDPTPLPAYGSHDGPEPASLNRATILAISPFNITSQGLTRKEKQSDITEAERLEYAESILRRWSGSGIPLIAPILPGYDAHLVFPQNGSYGFSPAWRQRQKELAVRYGTGGVVVDCWNGWSEGYAIPPSVEDGDTHLRWVQDVIRSARMR